MVKIKQSPKLPAEERRSQLLMAAQKLFAHKGYRETTTDEIAKSANLTKGALYFHFKNKEDILYELIKHVFEHFKTAIDKNYDKLTSPTGYFKMFVEPHMADCAHMELSSSLDFWVQAMSIPRIKRFMNKSFDELVAIFINSVDSKYGRSKKELTQLAILTYSLIDGILVRQILNPSIVKIPTQIKLFDEMMESRAARLKRGKGKK